MIGMDNDDYCLKGGQEGNKIKFCDLRRSQLLNTQPGKPLAHVNGSSEVLALHDTGQKSTGKGITSTIGIVDLLLADGMDWEFLDLILTLDSNEGRLGALSDNSNSLSLPVLLGQVGQVLDNILGLLGGQVVRLGISSGLGLITDDIVPVRGGGIDGILEELGDEGGRERQNKDLVLFGGLFGELHDGWRADCIIHNIVG